ncbi:MAG: NUDIX domain-containing protein [Candidatus Sabulitectum sp.]|nr:NUDIX domain-containing protein [Candidatus Sabulitectum sp.]
MIRRQRVYAYIVNKGRLLVFKHTDFPESGIQVPAGSVQKEEEPASAVMREAEEETGLARLELIGCLGTLERDMTEFGTAEIQEAWFYHISCPGNPLKTWRHNETSGGTIEPIRFDLFWVQLPDGVPELFAIDGIMLNELIRTAGMESRENTANRMGFDT